MKRGLITVLLLFCCTVATAQHVYVMVLTTRDFGTGKQLLILLCDNHYSTQKQYASDNTVWGLPGGQSEQSETHKWETALRESKEELHHKFSQNDLYNLNAIYTHGAHTVFVCGDESCKDLYAMPPLKASLIPDYTYPKLFKEHEFQKTITDKLTQLGQRTPQNGHLMEVTKVKFLKLKRILEWFEHNHITRMSRGVPIPIYDKDDNNKPYYLDYWFMYTLQYAGMHQDQANWLVRDWLQGVNRPCERR